MTIEELQSKTIDWLRFPLVVLVVLGHGFGFDQVDLQVIDYQHITSIDIYNIVRVWGSHVFPYFTVPCFFMFSGYLFFSRVAKWNKDVYSTKLKSRIRTLAIPYLLWNIIPVLVYAAISMIKCDGSVWIYFNEIYDHGIAKVFWNYFEWDTNKTNMLGYAIPFWGPYNFPLWYLRDLAVVAFLSPLIFYFVKYTRLYGIILLGIAYYTKVWFITPGFGISAFFFFSLGAYFSIHQKNMVSEFRKGKIFWLLIAIVTMFFSTYYEGHKLKDFFFPVFELAGVICSMNLASFLIERGYVKVNYNLAKASFFVYTAHLIVGSKIFNLLPQSENGFIQIITYFTGPLLVVCVCMGIYFLMKKMTPNLLNLLTGKR